MVLVVASAAILAGPGLVLSARLGTEVRHDLRADTAAVRVVAGPLAVARGRIPRLRLSARNAALDGASVDEITLDLRGVAIDPARAFRGELALRSVESGTASLLLGEESVRRYLAEHGGVRNAGVRMDGGVVTVTGQVAVLGALVEVTMRAGLAVRDGTQVVLDVRQLRLGGLEVPPEVGNALVTSINPILTAPREPVPLRLVGVTVDEGTARLTGEVVP